MKSLSLISAPLQGYTEAPFRRLHQEYFKGISLYCAPFSRIEHGEIRRRDIRDLKASLSDSIPTLPQAIFSSLQELRSVAEAVVIAGYRMLDLNLGCPFPPQMKKGRGAAVISNTKLLKEISRLKIEFPDLDLSVKMRLGKEDPSEWRKTFHLILNLNPLHITVHPRIGKQAYSGDLFLDEFEEIVRQAGDRVIYNGEIKSREDALQIADRFPSISGIMIGRGLLARPWLAHEIVENIDIDNREGIVRMLQMHQDLKDELSDSLCGDTQILLKLKPFWDYSEPLIGRKAFKAIKKAGSMRRYSEAVSAISTYQNL